MASRRYFGTDGVRGVYGRDLTEPLVQRLGRAFARWSGGSPVLIGRDTRASGPAIERALAEGLVAGGSSVRLGGVLPTPAVPLLAEGSGAVVSASHNPANYNGVKFFDADGAKLSDDDELAVEALLDDTPPASEHAPAGADESLAGRYVEIVCERFGAPLDGLRLAADCANGAMYRVAPATLSALGARVTPLAADPDGTNINRGCGATDLALLSARVRAGDFDLGVAFDGDGDRMLAVDARGTAVDGDQILAVLALSLRVDAVVVTTMANLGLHRFLRERGIAVATSDVGDRYVLEAMRRTGALLGGEQSGHLIWLDRHTTGDGLVAAILLARAVTASGSTLAELVAPLPLLAQAKENVEVARKEMTAALVAEVARVNAELDGRARVLVRPSGTEPVVRVLAEAESEAEARTLSGRVASLVRRELG